MVTRAEIIADHSIGGLGACQALSVATDTWISQIFADAIAGEKKADDLVILAVGGYGRRELSPHSDLDILLIHKSVKTFQTLRQRFGIPFGMRESNWDTRYEHLKRPFNFVELT